MLIPLILAMGCIAFLCIGAFSVSWAVTVMIEEGPDISHIIMSLVGIAVVIFACFCVGKSAEYYNEKVFTTSVPAQIDTTVTIKNGAADTLYTYHLIKEE